jgi:hypothetical protein
VDAGTLAEREEQDQPDHEARKTLYVEHLEDWNQRRDKLVLEALSKEGFCLGFLPPVGTPADAQPDFTVFLPSLDGIPNLLVAAPHLTLAKVKGTIEELPKPQFQATGDFESSFEPLAESWFRFQTEIVYVTGAAAGQPAAQGGVAHGPWAYCASLRILRAGTESRLRVIHIGLGPGRDPVFLHFLAPHGLVPRRLLL